jgi:hypothetical protein
LDVSALAVVTAAVTAMAIAMVIAEVMSLIQHVENLYMQVPPLSLLPSMKQQADKERDQHRIPRESKVVAGMKTSQQMLPHVGDCCQVPFWERASCGAEPSLQHAALSVEVPMVALVGLMMVQRLERHCLLVRLSEC